MYKRINKYLVVICCFIVFTGCKTTKVYNPRADLDAVRMILMKQQKAWNTGDIDAFMEGYWNNSQLAFIGSRGVTRGWQQTLDNYKRGYPDEAAMGTLTFEILELRSLSPEACFMIGKYSLVRAEDNPSGYFNLLWEKKNGQWVIVSDHTSG